MAVLHGENCLSNSVKCEDGTACVNGKCMCKPGRIFRNGKCQRFSKGNFKLIKIFRNFTKFYS